MSVRKLEELLAVPTSKSNPAQITSEERELIHEFELQPVKHPLQVVGRGAIQFLGYESNFEEDWSRITGQEVDTQKRFDFWYRVN